MSREWSRMTDLIANLWNWLQSMPFCARTLNLRFSVTVPIINLLGFDFLFFQMSGLLVLVFRMITSDGPMILQCCVISYCTEA